MNRLTISPSLASDMCDVPWFPKKISDLDNCANRVLMYGSELDADHPVRTSALAKQTHSERVLLISICSSSPGFQGQRLPKEAKVLCRSGHVAQTVSFPRNTSRVLWKRATFHLTLRWFSHRSGDPIPRIEFTEEEVKTWGVVYRELNKLYPTYACREYLKNLPLLSKYCDFREDNIPQLEDVSRFLRGKFLFIE